MASLSLRPSKDFSGLPRSNMLAYLSISSTISLVKLQSHSLTVHFVFKRISSLSSVDMFFIFRPLYKSINYLALMVNGVWTSVIRPSDCLKHKLKGTFSTVWGRSWTSSIFKFWKFFVICWPISWAYQWFEADQFIYRGFLWGPFSSALQWGTCCSLFFRVQWLATSLINKKNYLKLLVENFKIFLGFGISSSFNLLFVALFFCLAELVLLFKLKLVLFQFLVF